MASQTSSTTSNAPPAAFGNAMIVNPNDLQNPIFFVNMSFLTRLTASNYITGSLHVSLFLDGHNMKQYITDGASIPPPTVQVNDLTVPNP